MKFYPYDFDYKVEDKVYLYLYSILEDGRKICVKHAYEPYFYAHLKNIDRNKLKERLTSYNNADIKVLKVEEVERELIGKQELFFKITVNYPKAVPILSKELASWGVTCYEKDILFVHRYLRDNKITPMTAVEAEGDYVESSLKVPIFLARSVKNLDEKTPRKWKTLAVDIETYAENKEINAEQNPILMIAFYGSDGFEKVITWREFEHDYPYLEVVKDEKVMLERFKEIISEYSPEIITGYYSDGFDFPYIATRSRKLGIKLDLGLDGSSLISTDDRNGKSRIKGILHLDVFKFIRNIFGGNLKTDSYTLDAVAEELLGHRKHEVNLDNLAKTWYKEPEKLGQFVEYNLHDARLTYKLCEALFYDMVEFTKIVGLPLFDVIRMRFSRLVESYIMKRGSHVIAPNKPGNEEIEFRMRESIQGAFVYEPTPGLYKDIIILDFRSLYPTIISAHNLGPESYQKDKCARKIVVPGKEEYWFCEDEKGFLPSVLEELIVRRMELKREIKEAEGDTRILEARSYALKILANSFYGYLAFYGARWYSFESAGATTAYARNYIKKTIEKAEQEGFKVVYSDTDSCFLLLSDKKIEDAMKFMEKINLTLPGRMELEFEGHFPSGIFVATKSGDKGAKKKYALLRDNGKLKITGFETVRRNWSQLAKDAQRKVLELVLNGKEEEAVTYVKDLVKRLKEGVIPVSALVLKTQITRELSSYTAIGPHVHVAKEMAARGERVVPGMVVQYVISAGSGLVRERAKVPSEVVKYDYGYYINNQLIPAVESILLVLGYTEDDVLSGSKQQGLGDFF